MNLNFILEQVEVVVEPSSSLSVLTLLESTPIENLVRESNLRTLDLGNRTPKHGVDPMTPETWY